MLKIEKFLFVAQKWQFFYKINLLGLYIWHNSKEHMPMPLWKANGDLAHRAQGRRFR
jgi:hypothetical protein